GAHGRGREARGGDARRPRVPDERRLGRESARERQREPGRHPVPRARAVPRLPVPLSGRRMPSLGRPALALACLACAARVEPGELALHGVAAGRVMEVESRTAWIDGGFGRLSEGDGRESFETLARAEAHLGVDWTPAPAFLLRLHGT